MYDTEICQFNRSKFYILIGCWIIYVAFWLKFKLNFIVSTCTIYFDGLPKFLLKLIEGNLMKGIGMLKNWS